MKASYLMFFEYVGMIGVPVLLLLLALAAVAFPSRTASTVLLILIGAGSVVYGAIGIRQLYIHGGRRREKTLR
jgi:hypothetical protein